MRRTVAVAMAMGHQRKVVSNGHYTAFSDVVFFSPLFLGTLPMYSMDITLRFWVDQEGVK